MGKSNKENYLRLLKHVKRAMVQRNMKEDKLAEIVNEVGKNVESDRETRLHEVVTVLNKSKEGLEIMLSDHKQ